MPNKTIKRKLLSQVSIFFCIILIVTFFLLPIYWIFATSLKCPVDIFQMPPKWLFTPTLENYFATIGSGEFLSLGMNSVIIAGLSTFLVIIFAFPAGYSFARFNMAHKDEVAFWILSLRMFPPIAIVIPFFLMYRKIGLYDTHLGLILLYTAFNLPLAVWILTGFIKEIPVEIEESALVDGASRFQVLLRITFPLVAIGVLSTAVLTFIMSWNEFLLALILTGRYSKTLPVYLYTYITFREIRWGPLASAAVFMSMPVIVFSALFRKYLIQGITFGALKG